MGLILLNGDSKGTHFDVEDHSPCSIGRDNGCTICLKDKLVSKKHAMVSYIDGKLTITDLEAANGTFVNGHKITSKLLNQHDNITIGANVFRVTSADDVEDGASLVSFFSDKPIMDVQAPLPDEPSAGGNLSNVTECIHGMQSILRRYSNDIVKESLKYIFNMLPLTRIAVFNIQEDGRLAQGYTVHRRAGDTPTNMSHSFVLKVFKAGKALLIKDTDDIDSVSLDASIGFRGVHCIIGVPIVIQGRITAVLLGDNLDEPDSLGDEHLRMMQFAGKAIEVLYQHDAVDKLEDMTNFLPVCDWCKRIRDDKGYWTKLESFVSERLPVRLSKSCCPKCAGNVVGS